MVCYDHGIYWYQFSQSSIQFVESFLTRWVQHGLVEHFLDLMGRGILWMKLYVEGESSCGCFSLLQLSCSAFLVARIEEFPRIRQPILSAVAVAWHYAQRLK